MTTFVAEFTTNHMGNLNVLLKMVERAAAAGASLIKMQKKDVETFYSQEKLNAPYLSPYGQTYRDYRSLFEFDDEDYERFDRACKKHGIGWFSTVQDLPSLDFMLRYDLDLYKVASSNARNRRFLEELAEKIPTDKTIVLSVAGSTLEQIEDTLEIFHRHRMYVLHCVAQYPCPDPALRLGNIAVLKQRFGSDRVRIGYSGHEEGIAPSLAAIDMGAEMVERHFCLSRHSFVHHIECSLEPQELAELVRLGNGERKPGEGCEQLDPRAYESHFGMTKVERSFLVEKTYGTKYVGSESAFQDPPRPFVVGARSAGEEAA